MIMFFSFILLIFLVRTLQYFQKKKLPQTQNKLPSKLADNRLGLAVSVQQVFA